MSEWIVVRNWERFQHYSDRNPVWIKLYTELSGLDEWRQLTLAERGLLVSIWVEFARSHTQLRTTDLPGRIAQKVLRRSLDSLVEAGFIELSASRPLADRYTRDRDRSRHPYGIDKEAETVGSTDVELPIAISGEEEPLVAQLLEEIRDADGRTMLIVQSYRRRLPDRAFAMALESLKYRRSQKPPLASEARYVVAALKTMEAEQVPF